MSVDINDWPKEDADNYRRYTRYAVEDLEDQIKALRAAQEEYLLMAAKIAAKYSKKKD